MKIPTSIENILNENIVENARLELKKNWNPEPILHTICAFANDIDNWGGGYILIGVEEENGRPKIPITGLELSKIDKIQKELLAKCKLIQPSYTPIVVLWWTNKTIQVPNNLRQRLFKRIFILYKKNVKYSKSNRNGTKRIV